MGVRVEYFDIWQAGYAGASVSIYAAGTTNLLDVFTDEALTVQVDNPQILSSMTQSGRNFGKFAVPVYVGQPYQLFIDSTELTGVINVPLTTLAEQDASAALVTATGSATPHHLYDIVARTIDVLDSGEFLPTSNGAASAATNNATIIDAIGKAAALAGGIVRVPAGVYAYTQFEIPVNVLVQGQGRGTTILQSEVADRTITYSGDGAGLAEITLDGVSLAAGSVGVYSKAKNETRFRNVMLMRFETCLDVQGGRRSDWKDLYIDNGVTGARLKGDIDGVSADGDEFRFNEWKGGRITNCTVAGLDLGYVDKKCYHNGFCDVGFEDNTGIAVQIEGARWTDFDGCWWDGNTVDLAVADGADTTLSSENTVINLHIAHFVISGNMGFTGTCQDVIFESGEFLSGTYTLSTVGNTILVKDCTEQVDVSLSGTDTTQWMRVRSIIGDAPNSSGVTTDVTQTEGWSYDLVPGEVVFLEAKVIANGKNVIDKAVYHIAQGAARPGSTLNYDGQTVSFIPGSILTGTTSGATAIITADADAGITGTVTLRNISGEFIDDEEITDTAGGTAFANGALSNQNAVLLGSITSVSAAVESDATWACVFGVTAGKATVLVTGAANKTVEWTIAVQVTSG